MAWLLGIEPAAVRVVHADDPPQLKKVFPKRITAGAPTFTVRVDGKKFVEGAELLFDGVPMETSRIARNGKMLLAEVPDSLVSTPGEHTVQGRNPDGQTTDIENLTVEQADPEFIIRLETNASQEDAGLPTIPSMRTTRLNANVKAVVWGKNQESAATGDSLLYLIPDDFLTEVARIPVMARDKQGNLSNTEIFFVVHQPAAINLIEPDSIEVGDEDFELKVFGDYTPDAKIVVNDVLLETTLDRRGRVIAMVPASFRAAPAQLIVRIQEGGQQSNNAILTVTPTEGPFIYTIAPVRIRVGEARATLDIVGANFTSESTATIDGEDARIRARTRKRMTVSVPRELLESPGSHEVVVSDNEGNPTNTVFFEVVPDVEVSTVVGDDRSGFLPGCISGDIAQLRRPRRLAFGPDGLIYFTDQQNHAIRTLNPDTREVCTVGGILGEDGYNDTGNALNKPPTFSFPNGVAVAGDGTIYVSENGNNVIRRIVRTGGETIADTFAGTFRVIERADSQERTNSTKVGIQSFRDSIGPDASFRLPDEMVIGPDGTIFVADAANHAIRRINQINGQVIVGTVAGNGVPGFADGLTAASRFNTPTGMAISQDGRFLFVTDMGNNRIRRIDLVENRVTTIAGRGGAAAEDGPAGEASFSLPIGIAIDTDGVLYVSELGASDIRRIGTDGQVSTLAGGDNNKFRDGPGVVAKFSGPRGLLIDRARGILYVADYENFRIRSIALR
jgi:sugar lactone lactonase YvrE